MVGIERNFVPSIYLFCCAIKTHELFLMHVETLLFFIESGDRIYPGYCFGNGVLTFIWKIRYREDSLLHRDNIFQTTFSRNLVVLPCAAATLKADWLNAKRGESVDKQMPYTTIFHLEIYREVHRFNWISWLILIKDTKISRK